MTLIAKTFRSEIFSFIEIVIIAQGCWSNNAYSRKVEIFSMINEIRIVLRYESKENCQQHTMIYRMHV